MSAVEAAAAPVEAKPEETVAPATETPVEAPVVEETPAPVSS